MDLKRYLTRVALLLVTVGLASCSKPISTTAEPGAQHGRYLGVGLYPAGPMWSQVVVPNQSNDTSAKLKDDEEVIVVVDSKTGEVRQCGNLSGICISANPWMKASGELPTAPANLLHHADDATRTDGTASKQPSQP